MSDASQPGEAKHFVNDDHALYRFLKDFEVAEALVETHDRAMATLVMARVDAAADTTLFRLFPDTEAARKWVIGLEGGKWNLIRAIGLIPSESVQLRKSMAPIRNKLAHSHVIGNFDHPDLLGAVEELRAQAKKTLPDHERDALCAGDPRALYRACATFLMAQLSFAFHRTHRMAIDQRLTATGYDPPGSL